MGVYKRGDTWYISYFLNGKHVREAMGTNKGAAEAVLNRKKLAIRAGTYSDPEDAPTVSFADACDDFERRKADLKAQVTLKGALKVFRGYFAGKQIADITEKDVDDFILYRRDTPTRWKTKRAGATINREVTVLRSLLRSAVKHGMAEKNPASCPRKFPEKKRLRYLTEKEAASLLEVATISRSRDAHLAILIALDGGMRQGEIFNLRWSDIDFKNGQVWVRETKNGSPRHVPMTEGIRTALSSRPRRLGTDFIFWGRVQDRRDHQGFRNGFVNLLQRAGIKDFTFHDLRHTFASHLVMAGVPLHTVGQLLGHKDPKMTMRYAHLSPGYLKEAVGNLPAWGTSTKLAQSAGVGAETIRN
jgi:integrase